MPGLAAGVVRAGDDAKEACSAGIEAMARERAGDLHSIPAVAARERALAARATMADGVILARAVRPAQLADDIAAAAASSVSCARSRTGGRRPRARRSTASGRTARGGIMPRSVVGLALAPATALPCAGRREHAARHNRDRHEKRPRHISGETTAMALTPSPDPIHVVRSLPSVMRTGQVDTGAPKSMGANASSNL